MFHVLGEIGRHADKAAKNPPSYIEVRGGRVVARIPQHFQAGDDTSPGGWQGIGSSQEMSC